MLDRHEDLARLLAEPLPARRQTAHEPATGEGTTAQKAERFSPEPAASDRQTLLPYMHGEPVQRTREAQTEAAALLAGEKLFSPERNELAQTLSRAFERDARRY